MILKMSLLLISAMFAPNICESVSFWESVIPFLPRTSRIENDKKTAVARNVMTYISPLTRTLEMNQSINEYRETDTNIINANSYKSIILYHTGTAEELRISIQANVRYNLLHDTIFCMLSPAGCSYKDQESAVVRDLNFFRYACLFAELHNLQPYRIDSRPNCIKFLDLTSRRLGSVEYQQKQIMQYNESRNREWRQRQGLPVAQTAVTPSKSYTIFDTFAYNLIAAIADEILAIKPLGVCFSTLDSIKRLAQFRKNYISGQIFKVTLTDILENFDMTVARCNTIKSHSSTDPKSRYCEDICFYMTDSAAEQEQWQQSQEILDAFMQSVSIHILVLECNDSNINLNISVSMPCMQSLVVVGNGEHLIPCVGLLKQLSITSVDLSLCPNLKTLAQETFAHRLNDRYADIQCILFAQNAPIEILPSNCFAGSRAYINLSALTYLRAIHSRCFFKYNCTDRMIFPASNLTLGSKCFAESKIRDMDFSECMISAVDTNSFIGMDDLSSVRLHANMKDTSEVLKDMCIALYPRRAVSGNLQVYLNKQLFDILRYIQGGPYRMSIHLFK